jgi:hypothetical protein
MKLRNRAAHAEPFDFAQGRLAEFDPLIARVDGQPVATVRVGDGLIPHTLTPLPAAMRGEGSYGRIGDGNESSFENRQARQGGEKWPRTSSLSCRSASATGAIFPL